jgi:hypothetical protein
MAVLHFDIIDGSRRIAGDRLEESDSAAAFAATTAALAIFQFQRPTLRERLSITLRDESGRIIGTVVPPGDAAAPRSAIGETFEAFTPERFSHR